MKIAYISQSKLPSRAANSVHVMKMCHAIASNGHSVALWGLRPIAEAFSRKSSIFLSYGVRRNFSLIRLVHFRGIYRLYVLGAVIGARVWNPDIVYCRCIQSAKFAARLRLPIYFEAHHPLEGFDDLESAFRELVASPYLKKLIFITKALEDYYTGAYPEISCPTLVAPDGADPIAEGYVPSRRADARFHVGYVGQLHKGKGMETIARLAELCPWADFSIVGGDEHVITEWKVQCRDIVNLHFVGFVPHSEVHRHILRFDAVLLPNQRVVGVAGNPLLNISEWTSPLKAFEYMAAGRAIVSSNLPVLREVFKDGVNALLCDPEQVEQWQQALVRLSSEPELRARLGANAQRDFVEKYSWSARARAVLAQ